MPRERIIAVGDIIVHPMTWTANGYMISPWIDTLHRLESSFAELKRFTADASLPQTLNLVRASDALFATRATALGAMYAFEAQQPATAKSKLDGLKTHYNLPQGVEPYFKVHSANWHESEKILRQIESLPVDEQARALAACEQMAASLWDALTGIHDATCVN